jgi:hypothetical protein
MYQLGKRTKYKKPKKVVMLEHIGLVLLIGVVILAIYWFGIRPAATSTAFVNNTKPLVSTVKANDVTTSISEPTFKIALPGVWKETSRNTDADHHSVMWNNIVKGGVARWIEVYVDTIPVKYEVNYIVPVSAAGTGITSSPVSDNCVTFTRGAIKDTNRDRSVPTSQEALPSTFQQVNFLCDNSHVVRQRVGTSSENSLNSVTVTGKTQGTHKYFFVYDDSNFHPDYTIFSTILDSFEAK